jgi:transcriptional regulator with XRE-family HTH domain
MALAANIIKLRKQAGWSQEALAAHIGVSRQSVSKWESGQSTPDIDKIVLLADVFGVTTDRLLKGQPNTGMQPIETTAHNMVSLEQAQHYVQTKTQAARLITKGVVHCVSSPIPLLALIGLAGNSEGHSSMLVTMGIVALLAIVARGINFFIQASQLTQQIAPVLLTPFDVAPSTLDAIKIRQEEYATTYQKQLTLGISLFVLCSAPILLAAGLGLAHGAIMLAIILLLACVSTGLHYVIPTSHHQEALNYVLKKGDLEAGKSQDTKRAEKLAGVYWPLLVAVYLGWSFWTMNWGITWIVFPVGAVAFGGVVGLAKLLAKK